VKDTRSVDGHCMVSSSACDAIACKGTAVDLLKSPLSQPLAVSSPIAVLIRTHKTTFGPNNHEGADRSERLADRRRHSVSIAMSA
jgi:hypothetical protein